MTKKAEKAAAVEANKRTAYFKKINTLLGHIVFARRSLQGEIAVAYAANRDASAFAAEIASCEPVGRAVYPLKVVAVANAEKWAINYAAKIKEETEAMGFDVDAAAPYPSMNKFRYGSFDYNQAKDRYTRYHQFVEQKSGAVFSKKEYTWSEKRVARFVQGAQDDAASNYDAFIVKLVAKIGACDSAELDGNHVWSHSILTVRKGDVVERWKTQQIENVSVLGKYFPQWPTRLLKEDVK